MKKKKKLAELKRSSLHLQNNASINFPDGPDGGPYANNFSTQVILARNAQALFVLPGTSSTLVNNNNNPDGESSPTSFGEGHNEDSGIA